MSATGTTPLDVVRAHMAAEDRGDYEAAVACFTDDCWYSVPGLGIELRGKAQIREWYEGMFAALPDFRNVGEQLWEAGDTVFFETRMEGTQRGVWNGWAPTGRSFSTPMLVRIPIAPDGLMEAEVVYFDAVSIFTQLGILPEPGSRQERVMQALHRLRMRASGRR